MRGCQWFLPPGCAADAFTPFTNAAPPKHPNRQFLGFSLAINFQTRVPVMCPHNTDTGSFLRIHWLGELRFWRIIDCAVSTGAYSVDQSHVYTWPHQIQWKSSLKRPGSSIGLAYTVCPSGPVTWQRWWLMMSLSVSCLKGYGSHAFHHRRHCRIIYLQLWYGCVSPQADVLN